MPASLDLRHTTSADDALATLAATGGDTELISRISNELIDLRRANRRLSGSLRIVLHTLDSADVSELFDRMLEETKTTMDADGTIIYLAGADGFHLRGCTASLEQEHVPQFMEFGRAIEAMASKEGKTLRLSLKDPDKEQLRAGTLGTREVLLEDSGATIECARELLPPFKSFMAVPVWFGGHVIAMMELGWFNRCKLKEEDARLLDSVAGYLSVQLMAAFSEMRARKASELTSLGAKLRERMLLAQDGEGNDTIANLGGLMAEVGDFLDARPIALKSADEPGRMLAVFGEETVELSAPRSWADGKEGEPGILLASQLDGLQEELASLGLEGPVLIVDAGEILAERQAYLLCRDRGAEPFDKDEQAFLTRLAEDVHDIALGEEARESELRIAQALQTGMKNQLQEVPGISADGRYSSATVSATVGGDFYDLIRLPEGRACVIMGDVSGKGVEAASVSAAVRTALGAYAWEGVAPAQMVRNLNDFLLGFARIETFATLFVGIIDLSESKITYCSAGHPPALLYRSKLASLETLEVQSGVVGAFRDMSFQDGSCNFDEGDVLFLYTDGTTEARATDGSFFGEEGLRDTLLKLMKQGFEGLLDRVLASLDAFTSNHLDDDVALVALRFDHFPKAKNP